MTWETLLARLAALVGIESSYIDIYRRRIDTPLNAKVRILAALGFDVSSVSSLTAAVVAAEEEPWRRWLAPWNSPNRGYVRARPRSLPARQRFRPAVELGDRV
jgi:hypothetical protein